MLTREAQLESLVLDILRLPMLAVDPGWVKRAQDAIILGTCPGCQMPSPNGELCDTCYHIQPSHSSSHE